VVIQRLYFITLHHYQSEKSINATFKRQTMLVQSGAKLQSCFVNSLRSSQDYNAPDQLDRSLWNSDL
jgi:hypothetical protein